MAAEKSGKSKKSAWVMCYNGHGVEHNGIRNQVRVGMPKNKSAAREMGCPICKREGK